MQAIFVCFNYDTDKFISTKCLDTLTLLFFSPRLSFFFVSEDIACEYEHKK